MLYTGIVNTAYLIELWTPIFSLFTDLICSDFDSDDCTYEQMAFCKHSEESILFSANILSKLDTISFIPWGKKSTSRK